MKKLYLIILLLPLISACATTHLPVMATGKDGEYVVVGRNMAGPFSSLELAQQEAIDQAIEACNKMGKSYKKIYSIDRPMAIAQAPESTLYFNCVDPTSSSISTSDSSPAAILPTPPKHLDTDSQLTREGAVSKDEVVSHTNEMEALIVILEKKGILTKAEVIEELKKLKVN